MSRDSRYSSRMIKLLAVGVLAMAIGCGDDGGSSVVDAPAVIDARIDAQTDAPIDAPIDSSGGGAFSVAGIVGTGAPATGSTVVIWVVSSGSPDYIYKFGQGTSTGAQFIASFSTVPPAAAINSYGIGIGIVAVLAPGTTIPADGMIDEMVLDGAGFTTDYAIIYKTATATNLSWTVSFPVGYSCGRCVRASSGFDSFEVTTCSTVEVDMTPTDACNWT
jgi:hypothetical protein